MSITKPTKDAESSYPSDELLCVHFLCCAQRKWSRKKSELERFQYGGSDLCSFQNRFNGFVKSAICKAREPLKGQDL